FSTLSRLFPYTTLFRSPVYPHNRRFPAVSFCLLFLSEYRPVLLDSDGSFRFSSALQASPGFLPGSVHNLLLSLDQFRTLFFYPRSQEHTSELQSRFDLV